MEFPFSVKSVFPGSVNVVDNDLQIKSLDENVSNAQARHEIRHQMSESEKMHFLKEIINVMGVASGRAQNLQHPITSGERLQQKGEQKLYVNLDTLKNGDACVVGILKMDKKKLFVVDGTGKLKGVDALCVMDFYVHESCQRQGFGKNLFDIMLTTEKVLAHELAIDRPSSKFVSFLSKHYNLHEMIAQPNNFAVFPGFFSQSSFPEEASEKGNLNRHSYAGSDTKIDADTLFRRALKTSSSARPRSLDDIERCLKWTAIREAQNGVESSQMQNGQSSTKVNGASPLIQDALLAFSHRRPTRPNSTSWNLFGVPPPEYGN